MGGIDFGLHAAGYRNVGCVELESSACEVLRANSNWPVYEADVRSVNFKSILKTAGLKISELDLLVGGPPCQSYSKSSFWVSDLKRGYLDKRGKLLDHFMRAVEETLPKVFMIENVPGFISESNGGIAIVERWVKKINSHSKFNYRISFKVLNSADYGVPQRRERVFVIGSRTGQDFNFPQPTHGAKDSDAVKNGTLKPFVTPAQAFSKINYGKCSEDLKLGGKWKDLIPCVPPGENYQYFTEKGKGPELFEYRTRYWTFLLKLCPNQPSWTLQASPGSATGPFHWDNRRLSSLELARLQTIPAWVKLSKSASVNRRLIGNAVPSLLAEILGKEIKKQFLEQRIKRQYKLLQADSHIVIRAKYKTRVPEFFL